LVDSRFDPERLAYWYFRLNGFLTTENFVVHPESGTNQRTDADLLAVRFTGRAEGGHDPLVDDQRVAHCETDVNIVIAEVKTGLCSLNGPWTNPSAGNMREVLRAIGCVEAFSADAASKALHSRGSWSDGAVSIRLFAVGEYRNPRLVIPLEQQLTWAEVVDFVVDRFTTYRRRKAAVGQWSLDGRLLRQSAIEGNVDRIRSSFRLRAGPTES
jgi:hypothetical protein